MRYQLLKTVMTKNGEIAYLFDNVEGKVYRCSIEDFDNNFQSEEEEEYVPPVRVPDKKIPSLKISKRKFATVEDEEDVNDEVNIPGRPKPAMIPPALRGVFISQDSPGAAVETRRV